MAGQLLNVTLTYKMTGIFLDIYGYFSVHGRLNGLFDINVLLGPLLLYLYSSTKPFEGK